MKNFDKLPQPPDHPEHHDFIDPKTIEDITAYNQSLIECGYYGRCSELRVDVYQKLAKHDALRRGSGRALFVIGIGDAPGDTLIDRPIKFCYIVCRNVAHPTAKAENSQPHLRILTNELVRAPNALTIISHDFALDHKNSSILALDAIATPDLTDETFVERPHFFVSVQPDGIVNFVINKYMRPFPVVERMPTTTEERDIAPMGTFNSLLDYQFNLEWAQTVLSEVRHEDPIASQAY